MKQKIIVLVGALFIASITTFTSCSASKGAGKGVSSVAKQEA